MPSTQPITSIVEKINNRANDILLKGGSDEGLLISLRDIMEDIWKVMKELTHEELDEYYQKYNGFYRYMCLLDRLAKEISDGTISVPK